MQSKLLLFLGTTLLSTFASAVTWSAPTTIYDKGCEFNTLHVDIDSAGDGFAVWNQINSMLDQIQWTDEYSGSWSDPDNINYQLRDLKTCDFSVNSSIVGMLLSVDPDKAHTILANQLTTSNTWLPSELLSDPVLFSRDARVMTSANGDSAAVWVTNDGTTNSIVGTIHSSGSWETPVVLSTPGQNAFNPCVGMDANGNAVIAWTINDGTSTNIEAIRYQSGSWEAVVDISGGTGGDGLYPDIAVNASGDALLVWGEYTATQKLHICSIKLTSGTWGSPGLVANPDYISQFPIVVIDASGNGCCVWNEYDGANTCVKASIYSSGTWQTPAFFSNPGQTAYKAKLASDDLGNFVCIWPGKNGPDQTLYAATYEGSWSSVDTLSDVGKTVETYDLGINEGGDIIASYLSTDSSSSIIEIKTASF